MVKRLKNPHPREIRQILYDTREAKRKIAAQVVKIKPYRDDETRAGV